MVAISRHRDSFVYYTGRRKEDAIVDLITLAKTVTTRLIREYNFKMAIMGRDSAYEMLMIWEAEERNAVRKYNAVS